MPLPPDALDALAQQNLIEAIKRVRAATGVGLKEAKDLVDAHLRGEPVALPVRTQPQHDGTLPPDVRAAAEAGDLIGAIKRLRAATGLGLKEAKDAVEAYLGGVTPPVAPTGALPGDVRESLAAKDPFQALLRLRAARPELSFEEARRLIDEASGTPMVVQTRGPSVVAWGLLLLVLGVGFAVLQGLR